MLLNISDEGHRTGGCDDFVGNADMFVDVDLTYLILMLSALDIRWFICSDFPKTRKDFSYFEFSPPPPTGLVWVAKKTKGLEKVCSICLWFEPLN